MTPPNFIAIHATAPPKPAWGEPCNGCGVCCLSEPCPVGMLISRKRRGRCDALVWSPPDQRYRCGLLATPDQRQSGWPKFVQPMLQRWARRWIAAGVGCDCNIELE